MNYGNFDLLLTGDGDENTQNLVIERELVKQLPQRLEVLKVPHHGSKTALTEEFLEYIQPQLSVIEVGKNSYGHPHSDTIKQLIKYGDVLRTDKSGDIEIISDGETWKINKSKK